MVRQDYLEGLLSNDDADIEEARAIIRFIDHFTGTLKDNLIAQNQMANDEKAGVVSLGSSNHENYMDLSPDLNDPIDLQRGA